MIWGAVIVAAGRGTRFGGPSNSSSSAAQPMIAWSVDVFAAMPEMSDIVDRDGARTHRTHRARSRYPRVRSATLRGRRAAGPTVRRVRCGASPSLPDHCSGMLVHDGARPLGAFRPTCAPAMRVVRPGIAALLATPVVDTIKVVDADRQSDANARPRARSGLRRRRNLRLRAICAARTTKRCATSGRVRPTMRRLLERAGCDVMVVEGSPENIKVTHPGDLTRAEAIVRDREPAALDEEDVLVVECFVDRRAVDAVLHELEARDARIDGIDRDLPGAVAIRAYAPADALRGFGRVCTRSRARTRSSRRTSRTSHRARRRRPDAVIRVGHGFDAHRLVEGRPFVLGGVTIPFERGPLGHSDGDTLTHAICDALLGACALGDLGAHFPDTDPQWKGADSLTLLAAVHEQLVRHGWTIGTSMRRSSCSRRGSRRTSRRCATRSPTRSTIDVERISVKAKTSEGMGYTGDGSGIAAYAVALVEREREESIGATHSTAAMQRAGLLEDPIPAAAPSAGSTRSSPPSASA